MRRTSFFAGLAILAAAISSAQAQGNVIFHGIPASVTSSTEQNPTPGIPASVTSPTVLNRPMIGSPQPLFQNQLVAVPVPVPVYYPFYSYPVTSAEEVLLPPQPQPEPVLEIVETPLPAIYEDRPRYQTPAARSPEKQQSHDNSAEAKPESKSQKQEAAEAEPITILVFRDGHQQEIGNYAILGDTLYDLAGDYKTHKILLADLDLEKTIKVNEDRGYEFRLPQQGN